VRTRLLPRPGVLAMGLALGVAFLGASLAWRVQPASASAENTLATEVVRLIDGSRAAAGLSSLNIDVFLAGLARDGAIPCPDAAGQTIAGRAKDFADYGYMSHYLRNCNSSTLALSATAFLNVLQSKWGYGSVGEILGMNSGYGTEQYTYSGSGWSTLTYSTAGHVMAAWQGSSGHWSVIMGAYDRVGCGGWSNGGSYYYACLFSSGGPSPMGLVSPPTQSPFGGVPPTPRATPPLPAATLTPIPGDGEPLPIDLGAVPTASGSRSGTRSGPGTWTTNGSSADPDGPRVFMLSGPAARASAIVAGIQWTPTPGDATSGGSGAGPAAPDPASALPPLPVTLLLVGGLVVSALAGLSLSVRRLRSRASRSRSR
jgi:uncharacterized protein YkwD